jgi:hypothetical protein
MSLARRWEIPILLVAVPGIIVALNYFINIPEIGLNNIAGFFTTTAVVVGACAVLYGTTIGLNHQVRQVIERKETAWYLNIMSIILFAIMMIAGLNWPFAKDKNYAWLFKWVVRPLGGATYAMRAFYIFSAAFRAFVARTKESTILLLAAIFVIMGNTPMLTATWGGFSLIREWINQYPAVGGMRGFTIGVGVGAAVLGIRTLLGKERTQLGLE